MRFTLLICLVAASNGTRTAWRVTGVQATYGEGESWHESDVHETCPTPAEYSSSTTYPDFIVQSDDGTKNITDCDDYDYLYDEEPCNQNGYCNYMVTADCGDMCADASRGCCSDQCDKFSHNMQSTSTQCFPQYMLAPTGTCSEPYTFILDHSTCEAVAKILADEGAGITDITALVVNPSWAALSPYGCYYKHNVERLFFNSEDIDAPPDTNRVCLCQLESMMESNSLTTSSSVSADASGEEPVSDATSTTDDKEASSSVGVVSAVVGVIVGVIVGAVVGVGAVVMTKQTAKESDGATVSTEVASDVQNPMRKESDQVL